MNRRFVLVPVGSHGDVNPVLALGRELVARGHECTVVGNEYFRANVESGGMRLVPFGSAEAFRKAVREEGTWEPKRGFGIVLRHLLNSMPGTYRLVERELERGPFTMIGSTFALACPILRAKYGIPLAVAHVSPALIRSACSPPLLDDGRRWLQSLPPWAVRLVYRATDYRVARRAAPRIEPFARQQGVEISARSLEGEYVQAGDLHVGFWPEWFAGPQPDWPSTRTILAGFPLFDAGGTLDGHPLAPWFDEGEAPVLVAPASANTQASRFMRSAFHACEKAGCRVVVATKFPDTLPDPLPANCRHTDWLPYGAALPRCRALVHQGGIGATSLGFAAGVPQLLVPQCHGQFDNSDLARRLGAARWIADRDFTPEAAAKALAEVLGSPSMKAAAAEVAARMCRGCDWDSVCRAVESLECALPQRGASPAGA